MNQKLMSDIGENYEYVRTIIDNKIEIAKIDLSIGAAKVIGYILLSFFLLGMLGIFIASLVVVLAIFLGKVTGSLVGGILIASLIIVLISALVFILRRQLIFAPVSKLFYKLIADKD
jgi:hypothetical protein